MPPVKISLRCLLTLGLVCFTIGNRFIISSSVNVGCFLLSKSYSRNKIWTPSREKSHNILILHYLFLALMHINYKKKYIPFCGNRPAGSRYFPLSPPLSPHHSSHFRTSQSMKDKKLFIT